MNAALSSKSPENSETPLLDLRSWVTPTSLFFVRNHFDAPEISLDDYRLKIGGLVRDELSLDWAAIERLADSQRLRHDGVRR